MSQPVVPRNCQPCVWMSAGLLRYKLCNRGFDCEHCPLDAGLRGAPPTDEESSLRSPATASSPFPADRRYADGHRWIQEIDGTPWRRVRFGLDAFAAALLGCSRRVRFADSQSTLAPGQTAFEIDLGLGTLSIGAPLRCVVVQGNPSLETHPQKVVTDPYGDGWAVEAVALEPAESDLVDSADEARERSLEDLRGFRRRLALQLLAESETGPLGPTMADGGDPCVDLRQMLGGSEYLTMLRELIH